jgi:tetratricopeptide (TPR) repeat protein
VRPGPPAAAGASERRRPRVAAVLLALGLLAACTTAPGLPPPGDPRMAALPAAAVVDDVPFFPQDDYYCGPAALAMVLAWSGLDVTQDDLVPVVYTPGRQGTLQADILAGARRYGRLAVPVSTVPDLLAELDAGHPVLVFQNLSLPIWPQWHYAVATGYDQEARTLRLHSGRTADVETHLATFTRTWARGGYWALVVLPPDRLPATAGERAILEAAVALERADRPAEAALAYATILTRWPSSLPAWIGLGNASYATGDKTRAAAAFTSATEHHPGSTAAWQNLAVVLGELGQEAAAAEASARAEALGAAPAGS